ncbi:hypothetical protein L1987_73980 [Smallanthus sonchifolius]|uniref:Uncharacterized protein n=1 Tax=Smallanthus sonchifolius TaxID=185202 RepID=A0ACB9A2E2_9ASTR|nr:hypothetical protein L1987_73980 [Smallanthus sonchifolius]
MHICPFLNVILFCATKNKIQVSIHFFWLLHSPSLRIGTMSGFKINNCPPANHPYLSLILKLKMKNDPSNVVKEKPHSDSFGTTMGHNNNIISRYN